MDTAQEELATAHEREFVASFIMPARRERYLFKLSATKHRRGFLDCLNHQFHKDLDPRSIVDGWQRQDSGRK